MKCKRFDHTGKKYPLILGCDAFPEGIPDEIILGGDKHRRAFPGDHGIQFEPIDEDEE
jgi:hypothetical protein